MTELRKSWESGLSGRAPGQALAFFAGGCFWCLEAVFRELRGVLAVHSGYMGGLSDKPSYEDVCTGMSGHAELVRIVFDPQLIRYHELLGVFFMIHDPTQLNRQGNDVGSQYRSAVFCCDELQMGEAREMIADFEREKMFAAPIVTELVMAGEFHLAEDYHHDYYRRNPQQGYCAYVIAPKLAKFRTQFPALLAHK